MKKKYEQVVDLLRSKISTGEYKIDQQLPTESELMAYFNMSRQTIRKSLAELEHEGLIYRIQGGGTFVKNATNEDIHPIKSHTIAVITTHISDYIFPQIIDGMEQTLTAHNYSLLLRSTQNDPQQEQEALTKLLSMNVCGVIAEPSQSAFNQPNEKLYHRFLERHIPIVTFDSKFKSLHVPYFIVDDQRGSYLGTQHLLELGHHNILGIFKSDDQQGLDRMQGFVLAMQDAQKIAEGHFLFYHTKDVEQKLPQQIEHILQQPDAPTAIVCYNDQIALRVVAAARKLAIKIPEELSLVGFDDSSFAHQYGLELTTVTHPKRQMGQDAADLLLEMIDHKHDGFTQSLMYEPELIVRNSTLPLKK